jgi:hypothetical protein
VPTVGPATNTKIEKMKGVRTFVNGRIIIYKKPVDAEVLQYLRK